MANVQAINPRLPLKKTLSPSGGTATAAVKLTDGQGYEQFRVSNPTGTALGYLSWGDSTVAATAAAGLDIAVGQVEVITVPGQGPGGKWFSAIGDGAAIVVIPVSGL